ncbi:MAG: DUF2341 domain-containing protein [Spirochaetales bacterium]|nr:DUF2341 domain-containing protein [Spirochaetales bacterium]
MIKRLTIYLALFSFFFSSCHSLSLANGKNLSFPINPPTPVDDFQVLLTLTPSNFSYQGLDEKGKNLKITDAEGKPLSFWIEKWFKNSVSLVWVRVPHANTASVFLSIDNQLENPLSSLPDVFDPVSFDELVKDWLYSGPIGGRVSGFESGLMDFVIDISAWSKVNISQDYADGFDHSRWYVRKEFFMIPGTISFSGWADDDAAWTLIGSNELYRLIGGDEYDADGLNAYPIKNQTFSVPQNGRYYWAGRGQDGMADEILTITEINQGLDLIYTRKQP